MPHQRLRTHQQGTPASICMAVRAGEHLVLGSQGGWSLEGGFTGPGDPAAQAEQAMRNVRALLQEAGSRMGEIRKLTLYVTDRAWVAPVEAVIARHLEGAAPARVGLIVAGLRTPEMLVAIDVEAVVAP